MEYRLELLAAAIVDGIAGLAAPASRLQDNLQDRLDRSDSPDMPPRPTAGWRDGAGTCR